MPAEYNILVEGLLDANWSEWLEGMAITYRADGNTLLRGVVADQAALYGLLNRIRDMNLKLLYLEKLEGGNPVQASGISGS